MTDVDPTRLRNLPLRRALEAINGDREDAYGDPVAGFTVVAGLWSAGFGWDVQPFQVPLALDLLKTARIVGNPGHADSYTDKGGYTGLAYETWLRRDL